MKIPCLPILSQSLAMNRLFSIVGPLLFLSAGLHWLFGNKVQEVLNRRDSQYKEKKISIRPYGIFKIIKSSLLYIFCISYFFIYELYIEAILVLIIYLGYIFVKIDTVLTIKIRYTNRYLIYKKWGHEHKIALCNIYDMHWYNPRNGLGYILCFYFPGVLRVDISTADFMGLQNLKKAYDEEKRRGTVCVNPNEELR